MIDGPPPGAVIRLMRAWREYLAWWMLEKLSPPARSTEAKSATPVEPPVVDKSFLNGEVRDDLRMRRVDETRRPRQSA